MTSCRWCYFIKDGNVVLRSTGSGTIPSQVLHRSGWTYWTRTDPRGDAGPEAMRPLLEPVTESEARHVARECGLPVNGW